ITVPGLLTITAIQPNQGGNCGNVTVTLGGHAIFTFRALCHREWFARAWSLLSETYGNQMQGVLPCHRQRVVVTAVPVPHQGGQRDNPRDQRQQGVEPAGHPHQLRREGPVGFGGVLAALWAPRPALWPSSLHRCARLARRAGETSAVPGHSRVPG